jgi:ABC-2 type transport system ATP-binding protein
MDVVEKTVRSSSGDSPIVVCTQGLSKAFRERLAVDTVNLEIRQGEIFGLLGPNGSGKTTFLRMILGVLAPTQGQVELFGLNIAHASLRQSALRRVGALIEYPTFYPYLTGRENLFILASMSGHTWSSTLRRRVDEVLTLVDLTQRKNLPFRRYSLGMKQRLGIAAALLTRPELVILDEPTNGLDPVGIAHLRALLLELAQKGTTVLLSSHLLHEVQQLCTRVALLRTGRVVMQGVLTELLQHQETIQIVFDELDTLQKAVQVLQQCRSSQAMEWLHSISYDHASNDHATAIPDSHYTLVVDAPGKHSPDLWALLAQQQLYPSEVKREQKNLEQLFLQVSSDTSSNRTDFRLT